MKTISYLDLRQILKNDGYKFYNFYNSDLNLDAYFTTQYYQNNQKDVVGRDQKLHIVFLDLEAYIQNNTEMDNYEGYINAITLYSTKEKIYKSYILLNDKNKDKFNPTIDDFKNQLLDSKHMTEDETIDIKICETEKDLIIDAWNEIRRLDPVILSGFNSEMFDYPTIYNRLLKCMDNNKTETDKIFSNFGIVEITNGKMIQFPEYVICDLLYMYKPRDEGGLNYGDKLPSYSLDYLSDIELGLKKYDYKHQNLSLNDFYYLDPNNFLLYNIVDVCLTVRLNEKLKHIDLHNNIRRTMSSPFQQSLVGSSALFDSYVMVELAKKNKYIRHGISSENLKSITLDRLSNIPKPKTVKGFIEPQEINSNDYASITIKYDGAYVKDSVSNIINDGSLIIDLDATGLYPSMMLQSNISFDVYTSRILPPTVYNFLAVLEKGNATINQLSQNVHSLVDKYIDINGQKTNNKSDLQKNLYYSIMYLLDKLIKCKITDIYNPKNDYEQILLNTYLIPLLDLINTIHPNRQSYNQLIYDYFFDEPSLKQYSHAYVINNAGNVNKTISKMTVPDLINACKNYSLTVTGCCFKKHEDQLGIFNSMLKNMRELRNYYKNEMKKYPEGTYEHSLNNNRQLSYKVLMNSCYGVMGLKSFRYSDHQLAQTITTQGRLMLKIATYYSENYIKQNYS